jgi:hypothetical protein
MSRFTQPCGILKNLTLVRGHTVQGNPLLAGFRRLAYPRTPKEQKGPVVAIQNKGRIHRRRNPPNFSERPLNPTGICIRHGVETRRDLILMLQSMQKHIELQGTYGANHGRRASPRI